MNNELWYPSKITPSRHFVYLTSLEKDNPELYQTEAQERSLMQQIRDMKDNIRKGNP